MKKYDFFIKDKIYLKESIMINDIKSLLKRIMDISISIIAIILFLPNYDNKFLF